MPLPHPCNTYFVQESKNTELWVIFPEGMMGKCPGSNTTDRFSAERTISQEPTCVLYTEVELNVFLQSNFMGDV